MSFYWEAVFGVVGRTLCERRGSSWKGGSYLCVPLICFVNGKMLMKATSEDLLMIWQSIKLQERTSLSVQKPWYRARGYENRVIVLPGIVFAVVSLHRWRLFFL